MDSSAKNPPKEKPPKRGQRRRGPPPLDETTIKAIPQERLDYVASLLARCWRHDKIDIACAKEWGVTSRTVRIYIMAVYARWTEQRKIEEPAKIERMIENWKDLYDMAVAAGDIRSATNIMDKLTRVEGAYAATVTKVQMDAQVGVTATEPEKVKTRIAELLAKRAAGDDEK